MSRLINLSNNHFITLGLKVIYKMLYTKQTHEEVMLPASQLSYSVQSNHQNPKNFTSKTIWWSTSWCWWWWWWAKINAQLRILGVITITIKLAINVLNMAISIVSIIYFSTMSYTTIHMYTQTHTHTQQTFICIKLRWMLFVRFSFTLTRRPLVHL